MQPMPPLAGAPLRPAEERSNFWPARLAREEQGQIAIGMVLVIFLVFMVGSMSLDAGVWYLDHRTAQNQVDAAVQAAMLQMPSTVSAKSAADAALTANGATTSSTGSCSVGSMTGST